MNPRKSVATSTRPTQGEKCSYAIATTPGSRYITTPLPDSDATASKSLGPSATRRDPNDTHFMLTKANDRGDHTSAHPVGRAMVVDCRDSGRARRSANQKMIEVQAYPQGWAVVGLLRSTRGGRWELRCPQTVFSHHSLADTSELAP